MKLDRERIKANVDARLQSVCAPMTARGVQYALGSIVDALCDEVERASAAPAPRAVVQRRGTAQLASGAIVQLGDLDMVAGLVTTQPVRLAGTVRLESGEELHVFAECPCGIARAACEYHGGGS